MSPKALTPHNLERMPGRDNLSAGKPGSLFQGTAQEGPGSGERWLAHAA